VEPSTGANSFLLVLLCALLRVVFIIVVVIRIDCVCVVVVDDTDGHEAVQILSHPAANASGQLLSDEAVESIGREDYVRMVACLRQNNTEHVL
jgi:hypothetical protein